MANYRYLVADLLTDSNLASVPLTGVSFDRRISRVGSFKGKWDVTTRQEAQKALTLIDRCPALAMWVYRNNRVCWGGIIWTMTPSLGQRNEASLDIQAATFDSYAHHRQIRRAYDFLGIEQTDVIRQYWADMQESSEGNIGMEMDTTPTGVLATVSHLATDGKMYGKAIEELGDLPAGVEHTVDVFEANGQRHKSLRTGNLYLGHADKPLMVVTGQRLPDWSTVVDGTTAGTHFLARGDSAQSNVGESQVPLLSDEWVAQDLIDNGWPRLDSSTDYQGVTSKDELDLKAEADGIRRAGQTRAPKYSVYINDDEWTPNDIGTEVRIIRSKNDWWEPGAKDTVRPVVIEVQPSDRDNAELIKLTIDESVEA